MDAMVVSGLKTGGATPAGELVRLSGVHKVYGRGLNAVHALNDINMHVASGEMVALCGPSGHGKTSVLNLIGMLETATEGSVGRQLGVRVAVMVPDARFRGLVKAALVSASNS